MPVSKAVGLFFCYANFDLLFGFKKSKSKQDRPDGPLWSARLKSHSSGSNNCSGVETHLWHWWTSRITEIIIWQAGIQSTRLLHKTVNMFRSKWSRSLADTVIWKWKQETWDFLLLVLWLPQNIITINTWVINMYFHKNFSEWKAYFRQGYFVFLFSFVFLSIFVFYAMILMRLVGEDRQMCVIDFIFNFVYVLFIVI